MLKNILFDLDDTILDFKKAEKQAIEKSLNRLNVSYTDNDIKEYSRINDSQWKLLEKGEITRAQCLSRRFEIWFKEMNVKASVKEMQHLYENNLSQGHFFIDGAEDVLKKLYNDYDLYLVSNGTKKVQQGRLKSAGIIPYFKEIFISEEIGYNKPSKAYFDKCFESIDNFKQDETVIVGDSLSSDILGGINAGIRTIWYNPSHKPTNDNIPANYQISTLYELIPLIKSL